MGEATRDLNEVIGELTQEQSRLHALEKDLSRKQAELEGYRTKHKKLVLESVTKERKPAAIEAQQRLITSSEAELQILGELISEQEKTIQGLQHEQEVCLLQETIDTEYGSIKGSFEDQIDKVTEKLEETLAGIEGLGREVDRLRNMTDPVVWANNSLSDVPWEAMSRVKVPYSEKRLMLFRRLSEQSVLPRSRKLDGVIMSLLNFAEMLGIRQMDLPEKPVDRGPQKDESGAKGTLRPAPRISHIEQCPGAYGVHAVRDWNRAHPNQQPLSEDFLNRA